MPSPKYYSQYDKPQNKYPYPSQKHPQATGKTSGCGPTCMAMVISTLLNPAYTPIDAMKDSIAMNDRGLEGTEDEYYAHMANKYKLPYEETKEVTGAIKALCEGKLVVCHMKDWFKPGSGHFILAWGISGGKIQINDPASRPNSAKLWDESVFVQKCVGYFIFSEVKEMLFDEALKIYCQYVGLDYEYWKTKKDIDKYFEPLVIKTAKFLNTKGLK